MNENLNLEKILRYRQKGIKLYSSALGEVEFAGINFYDRTYPIMVKTKDGTFSFTKQGKLYDIKQSECLLFPSKEQQDWSKFATPWDKLGKRGEQILSQTNIEKKKDKFDPKTLQPFDKVLVRRGSENYDVWFPDFVSSPPDDKNNKTLCMCILEDIAIVIPYNDDTKHLIGTTDDAPEFYRYWED